LQRREALVLGRVISLMYGMQVRRFCLFCPYCGNRVEDDNLFCKYCGKKLERDISPNTGRSLSTLHKPDAVSETVLAGFSSADMLRPGSFGYGVYITDRRVIGIKKPEQFAKAVGGAIAGAVIGKILGFEAPWAVSSALGRNLTNDETSRLLEELEKNKDFEVNRQDITLVQLKEPFFTQLGQLAIFVKGEKTTNIAIRFSKDKVFEMLKEMFKTHFPEALRTTV